mmetsp:Transcript_62608/g.146940  ORF Transcript_62608/g.146940 Transcript_62608/m.146940 type:complete len:304 (+) Transcript_62608:724-1635(+)
MIHRGVSVAGSRLLFFMDVAQIPVIVSALLKATTSLPHKDHDKLPSAPRIVRSILKREIADVVEVRAQLGRCSFTKNLQRRAFFFVQDPFVLVFLRTTLQSPKVPFLPGEIATAEVDEDVTNRFKVITATLLDTPMRVDADIPCGTCQLTVVAERNVLIGSRIPIPLSQTEVNDVDIASFLLNSHKKILGLDVSMKKPARMDILYCVNHLLANGSDGLVRELTVTVVKQVLKGRAQEINHHDVVVPLDSIPVHCRNLHTVGDQLVELGLEHKQRMLGLYKFELNGDGRTSLHIDANVDVTKGS